MRIIDWSTDVCSADLAALLIHKAIGNRQKCVFVNNGLLRLDEEKEIEEMFKNNFNVNFTAVDAAQVFLAKLKVVEDPEKKRSEERRVGKACVRTCKSRCSPNH